MGGAPHAEEILAFYVGLLEIQETVARRVPVERWLELVRSPDAATPLLRLDRLPADELVEGFDDFLARVAQVGTDVISDGSRTVLGAAVPARIALLRETLLRERGEGDEGDGPDEPDERGGGGGGAGGTFHARAFLEPIATSLAAGDPRVAVGRVTAAGPALDPGTLPPEPDLRARRCLACGSAPGVAVRRDLPDAQGVRSLICSLCATEWRFARLGCPHCGEAEADRLLAHAPESVAHVRVDECRTCARYLKTVDLRRAGDAVPLVDELATVELDLWARERGLTKLTRNVLGL